MDRNDIAQEMRAMMLFAIRRYYAMTGRLPPGALLNVVIQRRVMFYNRTSRAGFRAIEDAARRAWLDWADSSFPAITEAIPAPEPMDSVEVQELEDAYRGLVYALRCDLPPARFALLHLRYVEELEPAAIAEMIGADGGGKISKQLGYAKQIAKRFLRSIGVETMDDAGEVLDDVVW